MKVLFKLGGTLLDDPDSRQSLAAQLAGARREAHKVVVVHGGGRQMTAFLAERGVESRFVNGLRVSTPDVMDAVLKVLAGSVNHGLVAALVEQGAQAVGLSGIDAMLTEAVPMSEELGAVGRPVRSNGALLDLLTDSGYLPVVACVAGGEGGRIFNVNADQMAACCAAGFAAEKLLFLTDVEGVLDAGGALIDRLDREGCRKLIRDCVAKGGMQAKLIAVCDALDAGLAEVRIAPGNRSGVVSLLLSGEPVGTRIVR